MAEFLRQLAATHSVSAAARSVGMSRQSAYKLRDRLKGEPFDIAWGRRRFGMAMTIWLMPRAGTRAQRGGGAALS